MKKNWFALLLITCLGVLLSLGTWYLLQQHENLSQQREHQKKLSDHTRDLRQAFGRIEHLFLVIDSLYNIGNTLDQYHFALFVDRALSKPSKHIAFLGVIQAVEYENKTTVEMLERKINNYAHFSIWEYSANRQSVPAQNRPTHYPLLRAAPFGVCQYYLGFDLASQVELLPYLQSPIRQTQLLLSQPLPVSTPTGQQITGVYLFYPIQSQHDVELLLTEQFIVGAFLLQEFVENALRLPKQRQTTFLRITDVTEPKQTFQVYTPIWAQRLVQPRLLQETQIEVYGRQWHLALFAPAHDYPALYISSAWLALFFGLFFTAGLSRYVWLTQTRAAWAENLVAKRTLKLQTTNEALQRETTAHAKANRELDSSRRRFQAIFKEAPMGMVQTDTAQYIIATNQAWQTMLGLSAEMLRGKRLKQLVHPQDIDKNQTMFDALVAGGTQKYHQMLRYLHRNGTEIWGNQYTSLVHDAGTPFLIHMIEDTSQRKRAEAAQQAAERRYRTLFENALEGIFQCDAEGYYLRVNPALVRMFKYPSDVAFCQAMNDMHEKMYVDRQRYQDFMQLLKTENQIHRFEYQARCNNGQVIWVSKNVRVLRASDGSLQGYEGIIEDITQQKLAEQQLRYDASHDQLTGLFNRAAFSEQLMLAMQQVKHLSSNEIGFAVLFLDLDRFKIVNDSMGHFVGDRLLIDVAERFIAYCVGADVVARFGGDEFAMLLQNVTDQAELAQRVNSLQKQLSQPYMLQQQVFNTTASIGIALAAPHYRNAEEMLRDADTAMFEAKKQGRGRWVIFHTGMHDQVLNTLRLESDLRKALENNELDVYYQPIISLENENTVGMEALLRWHHPERGFISPGVFIQIAEDTGLINEIGLWALETACRQLRNWQQRFPQYGELGMNVNISPIQLKQPRLVRQIQDVLDSVHIGSNACRLEITENAMMQDPEAMLDVMHELKNLEVLLYIDDFGTGYSSLSYLQRFPIDALKIDKSFIDNLESPSKMRVAKAIVALGSAFNLKVVAEGVETNKQLTVLKAAQCHHVQGFYFSKPRCAADMEVYLEEKCGV